MRVLLHALASLLAAFAAPARADEIGDAWRRIAEIDSAAALELIELNHPGARPEVGDEGFQARLATARRHVAERLPRVTNLAGYNAVMLGLATDFGDGHIRTRAQVAQATVDWAALLVQRRGGKWVIARDFNDGATLDGAELLACDGVAAETLARDRLGQFRANADVAADMARVAWALLVDDGNPFLPRLRRCQFRLGSGDLVERPLAWRSVATQQMQQHFSQSLPRSRAGMGVEPFAGGYWIALQTLDQSAEAVVARVQSLEAELRAAPMVVLDVRGNGGGNSDYATAIATVLVGREAMEAIGRGDSMCVGAFWRSSSANAAAMRALAEGAEGERRDAIGAIVNELERAVAAGQVFSPELPACAREVADLAPPVGTPPPLAMQGKLVLLTDRACFSSCLIAADTWRRLGALHVGEATDRSTRYMEVRDALLPSGLRTFSTLMKLALGVGDFGPFEPDVPYLGALDDGDALKAWVASLAEEG